jgi:protein-S-isoprenylcysteine O-methyltransferase Ste14
MESEGAFRVATALVLFGFVAHRAYHLRRQGETDDVHDRPALANVCSFLASVGTLAWLIHPPWMEWSALGLPTALRWFGLVPALGGFWLLQSAQNALGAMWTTSAEVAGPAELVRSGPYRRVRHPIYAAFLLIFAAPLLLASDWFIGTGWIVMAALETAHRIGKEETRLLEVHGDAYREYMRATGRVLPW